MPKPVSLTPEALNVSMTPQAATAPRGAKAKAAKEEKLVPVQVNWPEFEVKAMKVAKAQSDFKTISDFMLACFHAYMKSNKHA